MSITIDPAQLTRDLGGKWYRSYGFAPCPACQRQRRKDQDALGTTVKGGTLLMNCKKSGCDFRDILTAAGIAPGSVELDRIAMQAAEQRRLEQATKSLANARSIWERGQPMASPPLCLRHYVWCLTSITRQARGIVPQWWLT